MIAALRIPEGRALRVLGVHDPLSARVAEQTNFDAVWVSGFGVSAASYGIPDAGLVTLSEMMDTVRRIALVCDLPLIVDADTGYGDLLNVRRLVRESERLGVDALCIEDAAFPKRNSFLDRKHRRIASVQTMCGRVAMAVRSRQGSTPLIIARTEALTQGLSLSQARDRAHAYESMGADAILLHSSDPTGEEVFRFAAFWRGSVPLFVVPTMYPGIPFRKYDEAGIGGVILANQLLRGAFRAMQRTSALLETGLAPDAAEAEIGSMSEIHTLVGTHTELQLVEEIALLVADDGVSAGEVAAPDGTRRNVPLPRSSIPGREAVRVASTSGRK